MGLKGNEISPVARIAAMVDIFDAIACPRDYKKAKPVNLGKNQDYLQGLRKCLSASIENGTLTTEISLNPSMEKPAKESLAVLDEYIAKCA